MKKAKSIYGEHRTWDQSYWVYAVENNRVVLVRCDSADDAEIERCRMKNSNATIIGSITKRKVSEMDVRVACRSRGWNVVLIRSFV